MAINLHALAHTDGDENGLLQLQNKSTTSIVVVSGCMSNPEDSYSEDICTIAKKNFKTYCDYHGYKLVFYTQLPPGSEDRARGLCFLDGQRFALRELQHQLETLLAPRKQLHDL